MEFVPSNDGAGRPERAVKAQPRPAIAEVEFSRLKACCMAEKPEHGVANARSIDQAVAQHHVAAAFAMHRAGLGKAHHAGAKARRGRKCPGMKFRIAAGQPARIAIGGRWFVGQRREGVDFGAGAMPAGQHMRIDEAEGGVGGKRDALAGRSQRQRRVAENRGNGAATAIMPSRSRWRSARSARPAIRDARSACSAGLHQSEMTLGQDQPGIARYRAKDSDAAGRHGVGDEGAMPFAAHTVEHDPGDAHRLVMSGKPARHRRRGLRLPGDIEHQQHREAEARREVGGRTEAAKPCSTVTAKRTLRIGAPLPGAPSNSPMAPSMMTIAAPVAASPRMASSSGGGIAQLSRLRLAAPVAAAWKAGSI